MNENIIIRNIEPQEITIDGSGGAMGITNVYVNGVDVTVGTKAYVIVPTKTSELTNDSGFITSYTETDPTVPSYVKNITQADINNWNDKQNQLVNTQNIKSINNQSILGSGNLDITTEYEAGNGIDITDNVISNTITSYNDLTDTPIIPTKTSDLTNDSGYITKSVNDLENYYNIEFLTKLLPMSEDSGTELYLADTVEAPLRIDLNPHEITQHTTTGKNLLNPIGETKTENDITFTNNGDGTFTANGTASANTNFNLSDFSVSPVNLATNEAYVQNLEILSGTWGGSIVAAVKNGGGTITYNYFNTNDINPYQTKTPTEDLTLYNDVFHINSGTTITNCTFRVQLEKGTVPTAWEEYTGGEPSPNPGYPQTLHTVTGENTITVCGKNLYDKDNINLIADSYVDSTGKIVYGANNKFNWIKLSPSTTYTLSQTITSNVNIRVGLFSTTPARNVSGTVLGTFSNGDPITQTFTTSTNIYLGWVYCNTGNLNNHTEQQMLDSIMIEKGSTATSYQSYQSQEYPINLFNVDNPYTGTTDDFDLVKITTSRDVYETFFFKNYKDSRYYISSASEDTIWYNIGVYKYESDPSDAWYKEDLSGGGFQFSLDIPNLSAGGYSKVKSNYFTDITEVNDPDNESCIYAVLNTLSIRFNSSYNINTIEDFITWITNNPFTAYIARSGTTPEYQVDRMIDNWPDLALQYKAIMNEATAYNEATNILQDNYDLPYELKGKTFKKIS